MLCGNLLDVTTYVNNQIARFVQNRTLTGQLFGDPGSMESIPKDRRVRRTRQLLRNAFLELIQEKGYDRITVQDILDRADVGRSTFYAHYRDKEDLMLAGFADIRSALAAERDAAQHDTEAQGQLLQPLLVVFTHVEAHRHFWHALSRKGGADFVTRILRQSITDLVREHLRARFHGTGWDESRLEPAIRFIAGAAMGLLMWWLDEDIGYSAQEVHSALSRMATQGVIRFLGDPAATV